MPTGLIDLEQVDVDVDGTRILHSIDWQVGPGERWVVVGPNGSGKTTLLRLVASWQRPSGGAAHVLGERLGRTDMRALRKRIGYTSQSLSDLLRPAMTPHEVVLAAPNAALETWWHTYSADDHRDASERLRLFGIPEDAEFRPLRTLSAGERQRVLLARAFTGTPGLVALDEPTAGLDIGGREDLVARLDRAAATTDAPLVLVTHHLEEIPPAFDRVVLLAGGRIVDKGSTTDLLTSQRLSSLYGVPLEITCVDGRWSARSGERP
ncbi:ABC transporter ATP-binding protein [Actinospongicola halichondriae]|uniref:ABC transporter ATP-binding protein n=1 Tax=Actinospongicola halichondriae TaxID=3236844 RepID=UPI003D371124